MPTFEGMSRRIQSPPPREDRPARKPERAAATPLHPGLVALARLLARASAAAAAKAVSDDAGAPPSQETHHVDQ
jgi:hypothetical protein